MFNPIHTFKFISQAVIPTVYSNSLSYLEDIDKIRVKLNETIVAYNELITYYNSLSDLLEEFKDKISELDDKIADFEKRFQDLSSDIESKFQSLEEDLNEELDSAIKELESSIDIKLNELTALINNMLVEVQDAIKQLKYDLEENNAFILAKVEARLEQFIKGLPDVQHVLVVDPTTNKLVTINVALNNLYAYFSFFSMNSTEYDRCGLTSSEYDATIFRRKRVTSTIYDRYGKWVFLKGITRFIRSEYVAGKTLLANEIGFNRVSIADVGLLTSSEYDELKKTSEEYDGLSITSAIYDWQANRYVKGVGTV